VESAEGFVEGFGGVKSSHLRTSGAKQAEVIFSLLLGAGVIEAESSARAGGELAAPAL